MSMYYKIDENKNAIPCSYDEYRNVISEHVNDEYINDNRISTIFLGLNHSFQEIGKPLIFETMVFNPEKSVIYCERYSTWQEAEEGHKRAVEWVKNGRKDE